MRRMPRLNLKMIKFNTPLSSRHAFFVAAAALGVAVFALAFSVGQAHAPSSPEYTLATTTAVLSTTTPSGTPGYAHKTLSIRGDSVVVDIVDTDALRARGLSGRKGLVPHTGMLFIFPKDGVYKFWMKDMKFSIDIIWLKSDGTILGMAHSLPPESYPQSFAPSGEARYVIEVPAGYANERGIKVGEKIQL